MWGWKFESGTAIGRRSRLTVLLVCMACGACASLAPVGIDELRLETRVRVDEFPAGDEGRGETPRSGRFEGYDPERLYVSFPGGSAPDTIPWGDIQSLRAHTGRNTGFGIMLGVGGGVVVGALGFAALGGLSDSGDGAPLLPLPLLTIPVGGILGAIWAPEAWAPVRRPQ